MSVTIRYLPVEGEIGEGDLFVTKIDPKRVWIMKRSKESLKGTSMNSWQDTDFYREPLDSPGMSALVHSSHLKDFQKVVAVEEKTFPNEFISWAETHYEVSQFIVFELQNIFNEPYRDWENELSRMQESQGSAGVMELARDWTDEFEKLNEGRLWDGEWYDEINEFCRNKIKTEEYGK